MEDNIWRARLFTRTWIGAFIDQNMNRSFPIVAGTSVNQDVHAMMYREYTLKRKVCFSEECQPWSTQRL